MDALPLARPISGTLLAAFIIFLAACSGKAAPTGKSKAAPSGKTAYTSDYTSDPAPSYIIAPAADSIAFRSGGGASMENSILYYVNQHRRSKGLRELRLSSVESAVATGHSRDMATGRTPFGHVGLKDRMNRINSQLKSVNYIGENVAYGQMSAKQVVNAWLGSPGHRRNIEGNFTLTGIGLVRDRKGGIYYTQIFTR